MPARALRVVARVALLGMLVCARPGAAAICGDLNGDGRLTVADAVRLLRATLVPNPADCGGAGSAQCGDVNRVDGTVLGLGDVVLLLDHLVGHPTLVGLCDGAAGMPCLSNPGSGPGGESWVSRTTVTGNLNVSQVWTTGCRVDVDGFAVVQPGVTVTIEPGALVVGKNPPSPGSPLNVSALVFLRGSKINAAGTAAQPILMTSSDHVDHDNGQIGDWGGLTLNGAAPTNCPTGECLADGLVGVPFGGTDPDDSSGIVEYVRIEFAGKEVAPDSNLRAITLNGVGRGTIYDHVQANVAFDTCQSWFGGTVNGKYLVSSACGNDLFDTQLATAGSVQFALGVFYRPFMQNLGDEGIEWDNNENGFDFLPRTAPSYCNVTVIGSRLQGSAMGETTESGTNLRRGTAGVIANTIWEHFRDAGLLVRDNATAAQACDLGPVLHPGGLLVEHSLLFDNGNDTGGPSQIAGNWTSPCTPEQWYGLLPSLSPTDPTTNGTDPQIPVVYGTGVPGAQTDLSQFIPAGVAPGVANEPLINSLAMDCTRLDPSFFQATDYDGAFRPGDPSGDWLSSPWISFRLH